MNTNSRLLNAVKNEEKRLVFYDSDESDGNEDQNVQSYGESDTVTGKPHIAFVNNLGISLHFIIHHRDINKGKEFKKFIEDRGGCVCTNPKDFGPYSVNLVEDETNRFAIFNYNRDVFKLSYIKACSDQQRILNISDFLFQPSHEFVKDFDYMSIFFFRKYTWDNVPRSFLLNEVSEDEIETGSVRDDITVSSVFSNMSIGKPRGAIKKTRAPYSRLEKESIIRYIVDKNLIDHVRGNSMWKEMESANICPIRTWQSLKEHSLKTLSKEVHLFSFLKPEQKYRLKLALLR